MNSQESTAGITLQVAGWVAALRYEHLPEQTRQVVKGQVLDTIGCAIHGLTTPWAQLVRNWAASFPVTGPGAASVWGEQAPSLRPAEAALVNGTAAHSFELDDYHNVKLHPGAAVIPAALALAERRGASGRDLVTAVAAGYEVMIRTAAALEPAAARLRGWHLTGVCGGLGAAAACASLLKLDTEQTAWALGLGGTQGAGLFCFTADGAMSKRLHPGTAAQSGLMAAELAAAGFTGPTQLFEAADGGFLRTHSDAPRPERLVAELGERYLLDDTNVKPYSCCGSIHAYLDAARSLRQSFGGWQPGRPVRVGMSEVVNLQCGYPYTPGTILNAQMSLRYCVATALLDGNVLPSQFTPARLADPAVMQVAQGLQLVADRDLDQLYPAHFAGWAAAQNDDGAWVRVDVTDPSGSSAQPLGLSGIAAKFAGLVEGLMPADRVQAVIDAAGRLEEIPARTLVCLLGGADPDSR